MLSRRALIQAPFARPNREYVLIHEHILVDFIGADRVNRSRYNQDQVVQTALPHLKDAYNRGCRTFVECTPSYLGRDPQLLQRLAKASGLRILTNTGYYGAANDKYIPQHAWNESAEQLGARWTAEFERGIEGTGMRPAFIKTGVDAGRLSSIDRKLIEAAILCHQRTGLRIHCHTGDGAAAMEILDAIAKSSAPASAYVWVHAQNEKNRKLHEQAAKAGAWIEFDGINERRLKDHLQAIMDMLSAGYRDNLLISQDSGWYRVGEPGGGKYNGYTYIFDVFVPELRKRGVSEALIDALLASNPLRALTFRK